MSRSSFNLPNTITAARIAAAPLIAYLPFIPSPSLRFLAFALFIAAAVTDIYDGWLARSRNMVTDLGRILDPLADKLLMVATFIPMFFLMAPAGDPVAAAVGVSDDGQRLPFQTPFGNIGLPWWVLAVIIGREFIMTVFRQVALAKGVVISAIGVAKWKTGFQSTWIGASYFWFFAATFNHQEGWHAQSWHAVANFVGSVGGVTMIAAVLLTIYSFALYLVRYGGMFLPGGTSER